MSTTTATISTSPAAWVPTRDEVDGEVVVETSLSGHLVIENPLLNKGSVFSDEERRAAGCSRNTT